MKGRKRNRNADQKGFSLIEVMVAIVILTVGLLSLAQMMVVATNANALSGRMTASAALAKEQLELLKAVPFYEDFESRTINGRLTPGGKIDQNDDGYFQYYDLDGQPTDAANALYLVRWNIERVENAALPMEMLRITVRCLPASEDGNAYQIIGDSVFVTFRTANVA